MSTTFRQRFEDALRKRARPPDPPKEEAPATANREGLQEDHRPAEPTTPAASCKSLSVSTVANVYAGTPIERLALPWDEIEAWLREPKEQPSKDACALLKLATFGDKRNKKGSLRHDENIVEVFGIEGDYDAEQVSPADAAARLASVGVRALIYTSPSHKPEASRWRVLAPLSKPCAPAERARFVDLLNGTLGGILATESWTLSQVFYFGRVAGSPYEFHSIEGACIDDLEMVLEPIGKPRTPSAPAVVPAAREWVAGELEVAAAAVKASAAQDAKFQKLFAGDIDGYGSQSEADLAFLNLAARHGARDQAVLDALMRESGLIRDKWERPDYRERTLGLALNAPSVEPATADDFADLSREPSATTKTVAKHRNTSPLVFERVKGRPRASLPNLMLALRSPEFVGEHYRRDTFRDEVMFAPYGTQEWRPLTDDDHTQLQEYLVKVRMFYPVERNPIRHAVSLAARDEKFDSAQHWLNGLEWDGTPRVESFLPTYFGTEDSEYTRAVSLYWWTAHAGRVLAPGCQCDMAPVLVGPQGVGKSTAIKAMVPSEDHYVEVNLAAIGDTDTSRKMRGRLIGEIAELRGLQTRDMETIKAFITRTAEDFIQKYKEFGTPWPRRLVLVGTCNKEEFLSDETGNRRWLPVRVGTVAVDRIRANRDQLWAEARELWKVGGILWRDAERLGPTVHDRHLVRDSWEDAINAWWDGTNLDDLGGTTEPRRGRPFTSYEVQVGALNMEAAQMSKANDMRIAKVLTAMGCARVHFIANGRRVRGWSAPQ